MIKNYYNMHRLGLTNYSCESYGDLASAKPKEALVYKHYCRSDKCCGFEREKRVKNPKTGEYEMKLMKMRHEKVLKFESARQQRGQCPDCSHSLIIK